MTHPARVYSAFRAVPDASGGAGHVNTVAHETLRDRFETAGDPLSAELQAGTTIDDLPAPPRRFLLDHGAFADATYWAFSAPRLTAADTIAVTSRVCRSLAESMWEAGGPALIDLPLFADTSVFHPSTDRSGERVALARELGLDAAGPWLLCVGSYSSRKNTHLAVALFAELRRAVPAAQLILVLPEPHGPSRRAAAAHVERAIADSGAADGIRRLPPLPSGELSRVMRVADLLVHLTTCRVENFGLVVAEAMAAGLPVLASDWGGLRDLVIDGETGLLAPTHLTDRGPRVRWRGCVAQVAALLRDGSRWSRVSAAAVERIERQFDLSAFRDGLVRAVESALARKADDGPPRFSETAEDLKFATIWLQTKHPDVRDMSTMFRRLLDLEGGRFAKLLLGPAATSAAAPPGSSGQWAYPAVGYDVTSDRSIRVYEPAWDEILPVEPDFARLAGRALGGIQLDASDLAAADGLARLGVLNIEAL